MARWLWFPVALVYCAGLAIADNDFTYTGTPVAGQPFTITWTPGTYTTVDILLNYLTGYPYYVPTTSVPLVEGIPNSGSYVWNVPATLTGFLSLSIARDANFPVSYSPLFALGPFTYSSQTYATAVPTSTACTSAIPSPTGSNPFLNPVQGTVLRVGFTTNIQWQPTSQNTVTLILNPPESSDDYIASATIISNITNSGSFSWTPPDDSTLTGTSRWFLSLIDDVTQESSTSDDFNIIPASNPNSFIGPYIPPVLGQDHTFYWSPSTDPTVSILMITAVPYGTNVTIGDHVPNTGSFTWSVPTSITPGAWNFALVSDAGHEDSLIDFAIDATTPPLCAPQTSDALSSLIASFRGTTTTTALKSVNTSNPTYLSALSVLASLSSAREATITKVTPHVSTILNPTKTSASTTTGVTGSNEQFLESQTSGSSTVSGKVVVSTSVAGAVAGQRGVLLGRGTWEQMMEFGVGAGALVLGLVGIF